MSFGSGIRSSIAAVAVLATAGTAFAQQTLRDLTIPMSSFSFATVAVRIAAELKLFEKHGLNARVMQMDSANAAISALIAGSAEVVVSGPGELVAARGRGQPVVLVADVYRGFGASLVLSKEVAAKLPAIDKSSPTERLKALDGLLIASASATSSYTVSYKGAAEKAGASIRFTYMAQPAMVAALRSGAIQGFIASAPFWGIAVTSGSATLWLSGPKGELPPENMPVSSTSIQAMRKFADENTELMKRIQAAIADLGTAIDQRPDDVKAVLSRLYPDLKPEAVDLLFTSESRSWKTRPFSVEDMKHEIDFVKSTGASLPQIDKVDPATMIFR